MFSRQLGEFLPLEMKGQLFSKHYIKNKLKRSKRFQKINKNTHHAFKEVSRIHNEIKDILIKIDEASLEEDYIKPILSQLGHVWDVQTPFLSHKGIEGKPDIVLFLNKEAKMRAIKTRDQEVDKYFNSSIGILESKTWNTDLDKGRKRTPSLQIKNYLRLTNVKWGILTNGKIWRLYYKGSSFSSNVYLELDLQNILFHQNLEMFEIFFAFFSHEAFIRIDGQSFLDSVYDRSVRFSREIREDLDKNAYTSLKVLVEGFLKFEGNKLKENDLDEIHKNCLILLYRLLFFFFAESKELLKFSEKSKRYSLFKISEEISKDSLEYPPKEDNYWQRLKRGFHVLDMGSEEVLGEGSIVPYNGGLFNPQKYRFLEKYTIGNNYLKEAIDKLARRKIKNGYQWVDYETLKIRHLGSIYEKLLEYKIKIAETNLGVKNGEYFETNEKNQIKVLKGNLYLVTDKGERKATGSYYTPDYIVQYIIKNTVGAIINEVTEKSRSNSESEVEAILNIKVLDPAMGSGHFLVAATEYMAEELVGAIERDRENKLWYQGEKSFDWAKRAIIMNCIYGVDINPLATELSKVTLWLSTVSRGNPLSFLDHQLTTGNSLIGSNYHNLNNHPQHSISDKEKENPFYRFLQGDANLDTKKITEDMFKSYIEMKKVPEISSDDIHKKETLYDIFRGNELFKKLKILSDVFESYYFGNKFSKQSYDRLTKSFLKNDWYEIIQEDWVKEASNYIDNGRNTNIAKDKRFFHWWLEYPEIFFDLKTGKIKENPGFDVVIGNPPYVRIHNLPSDIKDYLINRYYTCKGQVDLYTAFIEKSFDLLKKEGYFSFINPKYLLFNLDSENIRRLLLNKKITTIVDVGKFPGVNTECIIEAVRNIEEKADIRIETWEDETVVSTKSFNPKDFSIFDNSMMNIYVQPEELNILQKLKEKPKLGEIFKSKRGGEVSKNNLKVFEGVKAYIGYEVESFYINDPKGNIPEDHPEFKRLKEYSTSKKVLIRRVASTLIAGYDKTGFFYNKNNYGIPIESGEKAAILLGILNSKLLRFYFKKYYTTKKDEIFPEIQSYQIDGLPLIDFSTDLSKLVTMVESLTKLMLEFKSFNLDLMDYIGNYSDGKQLKDIYMPAPGLSESILTELSVDKENLSISSISTEIKNNELLMYVKARYKPKNRTKQVDRYGYIESEPILAMKFSNPSDFDKNLIDYFVPIAIKRAKGFANFRKKATKSISLIDRLKVMTLPKIESVESGLRKYNQIQNTSKKVKGEIQKAYHEINAFIFSIYNLTEEEVRIVLKSSKTHEKEKDEIIRKFRKYNIV